MRSDVVALTMVLLVGACDASTSLAPALHDEAGAWQQIVAGDGATCGLDRSGVAYCWGKNDRGQLGDGTNTPHATPAPVQGNLHFAMLAMGPVTACGLTLTGQTYCWGYYAINHYSVPLLVDSTVAFTAIAVGNYSICGLTPAAVVYCWSIIRTDQTPAPLAGTHHFRSLGISYNPFGVPYCGITTDNQSYCWGEGVQSDSQVVRQPLPASTTQIASSGFHTCGVLVTGYVLCWGHGLYGELGNGLTDSQPTPVAVSGDVPFSTIGVSFLWSCAVSTRGDAYCWGAPPGLGSSPLLVPTMVIPGLRFDRVSVGADHTCFVTPGGAAYCMGENAGGQLGNGTTSATTGAVRVLDPT